MRSNSRAIQKQSEFVPAWISKEVHDALSALDGKGPERAKKERTVLRLAEATATGVAHRQIFANHRLYGVVNGKYWYGWKDKAGWKDDPAVAHALDVATDRALWWVRVKAGRAIEDTLDTLIDVAPDVAAQYARAVREGRMTFERDGRSHSVDVELPQIVKIGESVLNRVSDATAQKGTGDVQVRLTWGETGDKNDLSDGE